MTRVGVLTWDWREQPSLDALRHILGDMCGTHLTVTDVETGSDQYAWVFSTRPLSDYGVRLAWQQYWEDRQDVFDLQKG